MKRKQALSLLQSVLAAFFGVQSSSKHKKDFTENDSPTPFIITAILVFVLFLVSVFAFVKLVLV